MTLVSTIIETAKRINDDRTEFTILAHTMEEVGELATEITIACGKSYKSPSNDGVIGEAIDAIITLIDVINIHSQKTGVVLTEEILIQIAKAKLAKWEEKVNHQNV